MKAKYDGMTGNEIMDDIFHECDWVYQNAHVSEYYYLKRLQQDSVEDSEYKINSGDFVAC